jgi:cyclohexadieny/prephenate dehydrogenase
VPDGLGKPLSEPLFNRLALIGMGLIGSSIARVCRRKGLARSIVAADASPDVCAQVEALGLTDAVMPATEAVREADFIILCAPVGAMGAIVEQIGPHLREGAILSDVGSVKCAVIEAVAPHLPKGVHFVPAHPVAGTEESGPEAGFATLFHNRWNILTPPEGTDLKAVARVSAFWTAAGANVEVMQPAHHDLVLAITSHVPHLIAYNIVGTAADLEEVTQSEVIKYSAGGFRDFTRIAASDPTMWRDIFLSNKVAVLEMLGRFNEDLIALQRMIRTGNGQGLFDLFTRTRMIRRGIVNLGQETAAPDFGRRPKES